ncbi:MAG: SRPBCC family protein [Actinobacteria bacterium]|nr:SRPBCC family protein [Actinomycetota bacterium]
MRIEKGFEIPAPPAEAYKLLIDLEQVGACVPGGEIGPAGEDGAHPAKIAVKLGPMRMTYGGKVTIAEADEASRRAVLDANLREQRGQGNARAQMTMTVSEGGAGSMVATVTEVDLSGRAAQMAKGVIDEVADRIVGDMASCLAGRFDGAARAGTSADGDPPAAPRGEPKPINGTRLLFSVLWGRIKRLFGAKSSGGETA